MTRTERITKTSTVYVVAQREESAQDGEGRLFFLDTMGRWDARAQYAVPFHTVEEAQQVAQRRGSAFVCARVSEMVTTYTVTECPKP